MPSLQEILWQQSDQLKLKHKLPKRMLVAIDAMSRCRTRAMGGHIEECPDGHYERPWYNSCKHRSCPKCGHMSRVRWLEKQKVRLLGCEHYHVIFTLPPRLHVLWWYNRELMMELLFRVVRDTLFVLLRDKKYGGLVPGMLCSLHTWGRNLCLHPHLHCVVTAWGFTPDGQWVPAKKSNLVPYLVVRELYRGKMIAAIRGALQAGQIVLPRSLPVFRLEHRLNKLGRAPWNVEICERYSHAGGVATYLAHYVRGGPLSERNILSFDSSSISFRYFDHHDKTMKVMQLRPETFLLRLLQHVPPTRKKTVRYYGLYAEHNAELLNKARAALGQPSAKPPGFLPWQAAYSKTPEQLPNLCPVCGKPLVPGRRLRRWSTYHPGIQGPHEAAA